MNGHQSKQSTSEKTAVATENTSASSTAMRHRQRITGTYLVLWGDGNFHPKNEDCTNILTQLQSITNDVHTFAQSDECIDFLTEVQDRKVCLIISSIKGQRLVPLIHNIPELDSIYIYGNSIVLREGWKNRWNKIKGIYKEIMPIYNALKMANKQYNQDDISLSFVNANENGSIENLDQLEPSYMYTQLFKGILLDMQHGQQAKNDFIQFWRKDYIENPAKLKDIAEFERDYSPQKSIWWYSRDYFLYRTLNWSLRMLEAGVIIKMGFFISDLHRQIENLYKEQVSFYNGKTFEVFRGQGLTEVDFDKLQKNRGGLVSFNNFLSTSKDRAISLVFAEGAIENSGVVGILFQMSIDPIISSTPFASIQEHSYFNNEEEILFSMHTVFRIDDIQKLDSKSPIYQVNLKLTSDDDQQLRELTEFIRGDDADKIGWPRLGNLLLKIGQFDQAAELYTVLLEQTFDDSTRAGIYHNLGVVKQFQGDYKEAASFLEKSLEIKQKTLSGDHPSLATTYSYIGEVCRSMGNYLKSLEFYEKAHQIFEKTLPLNPRSLANSYSNIGATYYGMSNYSKALEFYEKVHKTWEQTLPPNHPDLATSYNNIATVYDNIGNYSKALDFYEKDLKISKKTLPPNHPSLATSYSNIGQVYKNLGNYPKALECYEKALEIKEIVLSPKHPDLATSYNNIATVYHNMGSYGEALEFYERSHKILEQSLPDSHPNLGASYNNIALVYDSLGNYSKALDFYEKALKIKEITLPPNHPSFSTSYNNIGLVYNNMGEYSKALEFYDKALRIREIALPANHPNRATSYNNIGTVYYSMGEYSKALECYHTANTILEIALPCNHPDLATSYGCIGVVYDEMGNYPKALSYLEKTLSIRQKSLAPTHPSIKETIDIINDVTRKL